MRANVPWQRAALAAALLAAVSGAAAQQAGNLPLVVAQGAGGTSYSVPIQTLLFFTALSFLPAVLLLMTGFTRIVIVLSLLRQALGTQAAPPNQVIVGLSLFLTFFVMSPTFDRVYDLPGRPIPPARCQWTRHWSKVPSRCANSCSSRRDRATCSSLPSWPSCPPT